MEDKSSNVLKGDYIVGGINDTIEHDFGPLSLLFCTGICSGAAEEHVFVNEGTLVLRPIPVLVYSALECVIHSRVPLCISCA